MCADCEDLQRQLATVLEMQQIYQDAIEGLHEARRQISVDSGIATAVGAAHIVLEGLWIPASQALSLCGGPYRKAVLGIDMLRSAIAGGTDGMLLTAIVSRAGAGAAVDYARLGNFISTYTKDQRAFRRLREDIDKTMRNFRASEEEMKRARTSIEATMASGGCDVGFQAVGIGATMQSDRSPASMSRFDKAAKQLTSSSSDRPKPRLRENGQVAAEQPQGGERRPRSTRQDRSGTDTVDEGRAKERREREAATQRGMEAIREIADDQLEDSKRVGQENLSAFQQAQDQTERLSDSSTDAISDLNDLVDGLDSGTSPSTAPRENSDDDSISLGDEIDDLLD